jgi:formate hydrogenlyase subunit 4
VKGLNNIFYYLLQFASVLLLAPLIGGITKKIKAFSQKRKGPPLIQNYFDVLKLLRKGTVVSTTSSWIYRIAPYLTFASALCACLFIPISLLGQPAGFTGDIILAVYLLALGRFFMTLAALDTGSTFGGMGSSREMLISSIFEPSLFVALFSVSLISGSTSLGVMELTALNNSSVLLHPVYILSFLSIMIVLMAETARIPVDDPATHLELTMVHEAMLLEYSGRHLALMEMGAWLKQLFLITVIVNLFLPSANLFFAVSGVAAILISLAFFLFKVIVLSVLIAVIEVLTVKFRFFSVPNLAAFSFILAFLGFVQYFVLGS